METREATTRSADASRCAHRVLLFPRPRSGSAAGAALLAKMARALEVWRGMFLAREDSAAGDNAWVRWRALGYASESAWLADYRAAGGPPRYPSFTAHASGSVHGYIQGRTASGGVLKFDSLGGPRFANPAEQ